MGGSDRGAVAIIVALVFVPIFIGFTALTVDSGKLYAERRQLQNAADAGALAAAEDCAAGRLCTVVAADTTAASYAQLNTTEAPTVTADFPTSNQVRVQTATAGANGDLITPFFAQALIPGYQGTTVHAAATATWGVPGSLSTLPVTFSKCEWNDYTGGGQTFAAVPDPYPPVGSPTWPTPEQVVYFHNTSQAPHCNQGPSGADLPGGFGQLAVSAAAGCQAVISDGWANDNPGNDFSALSSCLSPLVGTVINIPIYGNTNGLTGNNGQYLIVGFAPFFLTGYHLNGDHVYASLVDGAKLCPSGKGSDVCLKGYFTHDLVPVQGAVSSCTPGSSTCDFGTEVVQLIG